jgi:DNA-binding NarL/FixJ family response regulator
VDVVIVENSEAWRERLAEALSELPHVRVVGHARGADDALALIGRARPHFVVLDLHLEQGNGLGVLEQLQRFEPRPLVAVLTNFPYPQYRTRCASLGASYLFAKEEGIDGLLEVCRSTARELAEDAVHG